VAPHSIIVANSLVHSPGIPIVHSPGIPLVGTLEAGCVPLIRGFLRFFPQSQWIIFPFILYSLFIFQIILYYIFAFTLTNL